MIDKPTVSYDTIIDSGTYKSTIPTHIYCVSVNFPSLTNSIKCLGFTGIIYLRLYIYIYIYIYIKSRKYVKGQRS